MRRRGVYILFRSMWSCIYANCFASTAVTWALLALTQNTAAQTRLREELLTVSTDEPTLDELDSLSYLDCIVRETLRLHSPVTDISPYNLT